MDMRLADAFGLEQLDRVLIDIANTDQPHGGGQFIRTVRKMVPYIVYAGCEVLRALTMQLKNPHPTAPRARIRKFACTGCPPPARHSRVSGA